MANWESSTDMHAGAYVKYTDSWKLLRGTESLNSVLCDDIAGGIWVWEWRLKEGTHVYIQLIHFEQLGENTLVRTIDFCPFFFFPFFNGQKRA